MRSLKKISTIFIIISIVLVVLNILIYPDVNKIVIKDVVISNENGENYVSFNQDISLDFTIREAIDNGIPLAFKIRLDIVEKNDILPTKTIKREVRYYQIEYKSLRKIYKITDAETRVTVLGHVQRGAQPTHRDRLIASAFGVKAVDLIANGKYNRVVVWQDRSVKDVSLDDIAGKSQTLSKTDPLIDVARGLGIYIGDLS